jgi:hypothetical protein
VNRIRMAIVAVLLAAFAGIATEPVLAQGRDRRERAERKWEREQERRERQRERREGRLERDAITGTRHGITGRTIGGIARAG